MATSVLSDHLPVATSTTFSHHSHDVSNSHERHDYSLAPDLPLAKVVRKSSGTTLIIPNMKELNPGWTVASNAHRDSIREDLQSWIQLQYKAKDTRQKIAGIDADRLVAMMYPRAGRMQLLNMTEFMIWGFPWDDAIDDVAEMQQPGDIDRYRDETLAVVNSSLLSDLDEPPTPHPNPAIQSFRDVGSAIRADSPDILCQRVAGHVSGFIVSSAASQTVRKGVEATSTADYMQRREDNIGVYMLLELLFYVDKYDLPLQWRPETNHLMKTIWKEVGLMVTIVNDLLSLAKELQHGQYDNLVPFLMYHDDLNAQSAVDRAVQMCRESYDRFYQLEAQLYEQVGSQDEGIVKAHVHGLKDVVMGNLYWSYSLERYVGKGVVREDGSIAFVI
ncbi:MAG: hypothetical protein Q9203_007221 [Teloschistes exilis]